MALRGESGWQTEKTLAECMRYQFDNEIGADVIFEVGPPDGDTVNIMAHKYMLISRSEVFEAMFSSGMSECRSGPHARVRVEDIDPATFKDLLRYIYSEVVSVNVETAPFLVNAARKYMLPTLVRECGVCLSKALDVNNVIQILETSVIIDDTELQSKCLEMIVHEIRAVLAGTGILAASPQTMKVILQMDSFSIREIAIYESCIAWANHQLQLSDSIGDQPPTDHQIREILGDLLYMIRFPIMDVTEFAEISEGKSILSLEEKTSIFYFLATKMRGSQLMFSTAPRRSQEEEWIERTSACIAAEWYSGLDAVNFTTDQDILLTGIGLYTASSDNGYEADVEILQSADSLFKKNLTVPSTGDANQFKVSVDEPISIKAGVLYSVRVLSSDGISHFGRTCEAVCTQGKVTFSFSQHQESLYTTPTFGQIPRLYFLF